jgi:hypothetical protein
MPNTTKGIYYPDSSTTITPLESVFSTMATSIDSAIPLSGTSTLSFSALAGETQSTTVSFGETLSVAPDKVQVTVRGPVSGSSSYIATVTNSTTTGFSVLIYRLGGSTGTQSIEIVWSVMN